VAAQHPELGDRARGWLRHLWRKATTPDDWTEDGEPHPWWDRTTGPPMTNFPRFDLQESSYALAMMADTTPAWREVYARILDHLLRRYTTFWSAVDWLTQIGHDPKRKDYPEAWKGVLIPAQVWGEYDSPGWTANGTAPWGLQPDPVGADGNLFFRGFFNLVLSIYAYVADDGKWQAPFQVAGVDRSRHEWTHACIAEFLSHQWADRPDGPHCENTKIWPYCLSAAGLGLQLFDRIYSTGHHWVYDRWVGEVKRRFLRTTDDGRFESLALYYDPILDHAQHLGPGGGLAPAFYVLPQHRALAETLYEGGVAALGWRDPARAIGKPDGRLGATVLMLARELGDDVVEARLREVADSAYEPRHFGAEGSEFGYWFGLGETYPRGQWSALAICSDVGERGAWSRVFTAPNLRKFDEPTVTAVEYPRLGIARAWNDAASGVLHIATYAGEPSARGAATRFRVEKLPAVDRLTVRRDGESFPRWRAVAPGAIEIESEVGAHAFEVSTTGPEAALDRARERRAASSPRGAATAAGPLIAPATSTASVRAAARAIQTGAGICPCCAR
jgi:hypothetical protein